MSDVVVNMSMPLDDKKYFRRQCPKCRKEFKVLLEEKELAELAKMGIDSFLTEKKQEEDIEKEEPERAENICPYCSQSSDEWWTDEQMAYVRVYAENILKRMVNKQLIKPMKNRFGQPSGGMFSIEFKGEEMREEEPWISPETNDMQIFELPCCGKKIKIADDWKETVHCFFCGFPFKIHQEDK